MANEKRLIYADDAKEMLRNHADEFSDVLNRREKALLIGGGTSCIDKCPTVDAAPVVHAHWEDGCAIRNGKEVYKSIDCSHCNEIFKTEDREYWKKRFKVCPFCGAIMDGERRTDGNET